MSDLFYNTNERSKNFSNLFKIFKSMETIFSAIVVLVILALWASALFDVVPWQFNLPATVVLILVWAVVIYNTLVKLRTRVREAWADIDVQLKRRYDLIPNLVEAVKGYASHERELFEKVTEARTRAMGAKTLAEHAQAENFLTETLKSLFAVAENYPQLQASQNFLELQRELRDTEDKIQAARRFYNGNVRDYNIRIQSIPDVIFARALGFKKEEFFELEEGSEAREEVKVQF